MTITELTVTNSESELNTRLYIHYLCIACIVILFSTIISKLVSQVLEYLTKQKKQIELNSTLINSLIENTDHINLKYNETVDELKQHTLEINNGIYNDIANIKKQFYNETAKISDCVNLKYNNTLNAVNELKQHTIEVNNRIYNDIANIKNQFYSETAKISDCISNIQTINNNIIKAANNKTKINVLVEKINKYFEFFRELDLKKGETYKKKLYFDLKRINPQTNAELNLYDGFDCFSSVDPYEITPLLMKYFEKYYDKTIDKFYPLDIQVFAGDTQGTTLDWYDAEQKRIANIWGNNFKTHEYLKGVYSTINQNHLTHIKFMNRNSVRLLDETDEEFEIKILQHILYELQDKYVFYKQIEFYTKPIEK